MDQTDENYFIKKANFPYPKIEDYPNNRYPEAGIIVTQIRDTARRTLRGEVELPAGKKLLSDLLNDLEKLTKEK